MKNFVLPLFLLLSSSFLTAFECGTFEVGGEYLYWKLYQDSMGYAILEEGTTNRTNTLILPRFRYDGGFRVYAAYQPCQTCWRIGVSFTRFCQTIQTNHSVAPVGGDSAFFLNSNTFPVYTVLASLPFFEMNSRWRSCFYLFDLDAARAISICRGIDIEPHLGFRALCINEKITIEGFALEGDLLSSLHQKFNGYGVEGGLNALINFSERFSLIGSLGGSLLYAWQRLNEEVLLDEGMMDFLTIHVAERYWQFSPSIDAFVALQYSSFVCGWPAEVHAGWETKLIFNNNHFGVFGGSNLSLHGLTLGGAIRF